MPNNDNEIIPTENFDAQSLEWLSKNTHEINKAIAITARDMLSLTEQQCIFTLAYHPDSSRDDMNSRTYVIAFQNDAELEDKIEEHGRDFIEEIDWNEVMKEHLDGAGGIMLPEDDL